jgi:hypothetical protein
MGPTGCPKPICQNLINRGPYIQGTPYTGDPIHRGIPYTGIPQTEIPYTEIPYTEIPSTEIPSTGDRISTFRNNGTVLRRLVFEQRANVHWGLAG